MTELPVKSLARNDGLRLALARGEFEVFYQPKVSCLSGAIVGVEALVRWRHPDFGLIAPADYHLFALAGRDIRLASLEEAKRWQIGTVQQTVGEQYLLAQGFQKGQNLQSSVRNELNYEKLQQGRIDLWIMNRLTAYQLVRQAGHVPGKTLQDVLRIEALSGQGGYYMAFGAQTPDAVVEQFRKGLQATVRNGTYDRIQRKWQ